MSVPKLQSLASIFMDSLLILIILQGFIEFLLYTSVCNEEWFVLIFCDYGCDWPDGVLPSSMPSVQRFHVWARIFNLENRNFSNLPCFKPRNHGTEKLTVVNRDYIKNPFEMESDVDRVSSNGKTTWKYNSFNETNKARHMCEYNHVTVNKSM